MVWPPDDPDVPGKRITLVADDLESATMALKAEYGEDAIFTLWNEEDAHRPR